MQGFVETAIGPVPKVATSLCAKDTVGTIGARTGFGRNDYKITPGLYCVGSPSDSAPVIVTANYKLSFDSVRKELADIDCWILVVDTRGINVWCAAGKGTFSAEEIAYQVQKAQLGNVVNHRELTLPQLCANGVAVRKLKKLCGFRGRFGPISAAMLPKYLKSGQINEKMRTVTFSVKERAVLVPLEICMLWKQFLQALIVFLLLSTITPDFFSLSQTIERTAMLTIATLIAIVSGAVLTPILLPWVPFRQFWLKGAIIGGIFGVALALFSSEIPLFEQIALILWISACSSYLAMNFTGSTVFTSLSGVAKEMRQGLPFQIGATCVAIICWLVARFLQ